MPGACRQWRHAPAQELYIYPQECRYEEGCEACNLIKRAAFAYDGFSPSPRPYIPFVFRAAENGSYSTVGFNEPRHEGGIGAVLWGIQGVQNPWDLEAQKPSLLQSSRDSASFLPAAQRWLEDCHRNHGKQCELPQDPVLPTRVLDLDPSGVGLDKATTVTLYEPRGKTRRYICLSYCWGTADFTKTTPDTIEAHKRGLDPQHLPRTFQDAIYIARALKVQYLWIDALCIIQNEITMADWTAESARMADVYQNSYLTIAPAWGTSVLDGCSSDPEPATQIGSVMAQKTNHFPIIKMLGKPHDFPLLTRGWVYQERMLSSRILYFGRQELLWDCWKGRTCGCRLQHYRLGEDKKSLFHRAIFGPGMKKDGLHDLLGIVWRSMVIQYSPLQLSFPEDKLPAFSGLANLWMSRTGWQYLAGLWRENLVSDMCWHAARVLRGPQLVTPQAQWRAPTWSWASVDGVVDYDVSLHAPPISDELSRVQKLAEATAAHCELTGSSPTGQVKNGWVELTCCLYPVSRSGQTIYAAGPLAKRDSGAGSEEGLAKRLPLQWYSDGRGEVEENGEHYLIPMVNTKTSFYGLVVKPEQGLLVMSRIGMAEGRSLGAPMLTEKQTVRIV